MPELSDGEIVTAIRAKEPDAAVLFFDRYGRYVERLLRRVLGHDSEFEDVVHDVFAHALTSIHKLRDPEALRPWLTRIAVFTARTHIRSKTRRKWLQFRDPAELPEIPCGPGHEATETRRRVYLCLQRLKADERIAFSLRALHEMTLPEVANACDVSLATAKRRVSRGRAAFIRQVNRDPVLRERAGGPEQ